MNCKHLKVGNKFKGKINNEIFEITEINYNDNIVSYVCKGKENWCPIETFKRCLLEEAN